MDAISVDVSLLVGTWKKVTNSRCSRAYPKVLELRSGGLYSGAGLQRSDAPGWASGSWQIMGTCWIRFSTANHAITTYEFGLSGDTLTFVDPDNCSFQYRRAKAP